MRFCSSPHFRQERRKAIRRRVVVVGFPQRTAVAADDRANDFSPRCDSHEQCMPRLMRSYRAIFTAFLAAFRNDNRIKEPHLSDRHNLLKFYPTLTYTL